MKLLTLRTAAIACMLFGCGLIGLTPYAGATPTITRTLEDLTDLIPGDDLWKASYTLAGTLPTLNQGFTVYFDATLYTGLSGNFASASSNWDVLLIQPDTGLLAPGFLDGLSLLTNPTFGGPFTVTFTLLGGGTPGAQVFEHYSLESGFSVLATSTVTTGTAAVPDLSSLGFECAIVVSLLVFAGRRVRRSLENQQLQVA